MLDRRHFLAAAGLALPSLRAAAQDYPRRAVKFIVPYAAGGGPDVLARKLGPTLGQVLGQPVVIDNIVGAGGILAAQSVARAAPDGYTVLLGSSTHVTQKAMQPSVKFDPLKDFAHVTRTTLTPQLLVVPVDSPWKTIQDLVAAARRAPGRLNYASGGVGSAAHLAGAAFAHANGLDLVHVPYKGSVEIVPSILSGATQFGCPVASSAIAHIQQGKIRALASTGSQRLARLPQAPTLREVFGTDDLVIEPWSGVWLPAGTPAAIVDILFKAHQQAYAAPGVQADNEAAGAAVALSASPAEFTRFIEAETAKYERLVKTTGLTTA